MTRRPTREELSHERLGDRFADAVSMYDTGRRVEVLVDEFLRGRLEGRRVLDVGCGLGFFSERLAARGARVVATDIGPALVGRARARAGCEGVVADALRLTDVFGRGRFDVVVSSECIEHTPDPPKAIVEMLGVLKPGGLLSLSTPNLLWQPIVRMATALGLRPFDGLENFSTWRGIRDTIDANGGIVLEERGLHLFPFQIPLRALSRYCDRRLQIARGLMINICVLAEKRAEVEAT